MDDVPFPSDVLLAGALKPLLDRPEFNGGTLTMKRLLKTLRLAPALALVLAPLAQASTITNTFSVTASVTNACTVSGTGLAFGAYDPTATSPLDGSSVVSVLCTINDAYTIGLNQGVNGSNVTNRKMSDGNSHSINYALYSDSGRTSNWDNTGSGVVSEP